jgi:uncharacterized membrane protein YfcA
MVALKLIITGIIAGVAAGFFGIGGGLIIVPSLVFLMGFSQHKATGTSLAILLPPLGLGAVYEYAKKGNVDWGAAIIIGSLLALGAWYGGRTANKLPETELKLGFGVFCIVAGVYTIWTALLKMRAS